MRPIDADALKEELKEPNVWWETESQAQGIIDAAPTIDPVKHGKWEVLDAEEPRWYGCSECKKMSRWPYNYCPHCGARMDMGDE